ncbi:hypothetical protein SAMN02799622_05241 [Methylobacterium sp. UNC378MF]|uniref:hypothetical protein n=1 Tax=Methylobacterium sp. UNC378MF TaxID=1502748 RepID=UPI00088CC5F6|nr:hypothetical protein [Methylobacterium sp. UNC378MF]SDA32470.1 hypothetical protein SAMN02799622_05241 [Methylobacterium sp. UNC378MF]
MSADGSFPQPWNISAPSRNAPEHECDGIWPVDPDPNLTKLSGRQLWHFRAGMPVGIDVNGVRMDAGDARIALLGIRRDARAHPYPAIFTHAPATGEPLRSPIAAEEPATLDIDRDSVFEIPLPSGVPVLVRAGRPAGLYLFQENLGALEIWDGRAFRSLGRLPAAAPGTTLTATPEGISYTTADALVSVALPQLGPRLAFGEGGLPRLRFLSAPGWRGTELLALAERDGRLVLCQGSVGVDALDLRDLGGSSSGTPFCGPWMNRLGDMFWTGSNGFVACRAGGPDGNLVAWPGGFVPITAQAPWRDRADQHHQLGTLDGLYHLAAVTSDPTFNRLDGPRLAAGSAAYWGADRFDLPWQAPAETLTLGAHAGALLLPLLALQRDTVLLALAIDGPRAAFLKGAPLPGPATGHVLHHAHGAGLHRLPITLEVSALRDAGALLHDGTLHLWTRSGRRCHALRLRTA